MPVDDISILINKKVLQCEMELISSAGESMKAKWKNFAELQLDLNEGAQLNEAPLT